MSHSLTDLVAAGAAVAALCGVGYCALCLYSALRFLLRRREGAAPFAPPVSILKPLRGTDPEILQSFRSHCQQDYGDYEIIFGVSDVDDAAVPLVEALQREFPERSIRLLVCRQVLGANRKVSNLIQMLAAASHEYLVVNDSDICVPRDYLARVIAAFAASGPAAAPRPEVGMVTCMYRGQASPPLSPTPGSTLEALGISTEFHPGVLAARQLEGGIHFALGSTLAFSRKSLAAIGGLEPLVDYLADDYELGRRISQAGYRVELSPLVVDTHLPAYSIAEFFRHQLRWARSTRHSRRWGYLGLVLTFAIPWAALSALAGWGQPWRCWLLAGAVAMRAAVAVTVGWGVLRDRQVLRYLWLLPLRDLVGLAVWLASYGGHTVAWRGDEFILKDGKLTPA